MAAPWRTLPSRTTATAEGAGEAAEEVAAAGTRAVAVAITTISTADITITAVAAAPGPTVEAEEEEEEAAAPATFPTRRLSTGGRRLPRRPRHHVEDPTAAPGTTTTDTTHPTPVPCISHHRRTLPPFSTSCRFPAALAKPSSRTPHRRGSPLPMGPACVAEADEAAALRSAVSTVAAPPPTAAAQVGEEVRPGRMVLADATRCGGGDERRGPRPCVLFFPPEIEL